MKNFINRSKNNFISLIVLGLILGVPLFYLFLSLSYPYISGLIWRDINLTGLKVNNTEYNLNQGKLSKNGKERSLHFELNPASLLENDKVLRLALFYQINKENPLFTGPGLDKEQYKKSIEKLEKINQRLLNNTGFKENVVPINFLKKTVEVIEAQRKFENEKSLTNARILIDKNKETNNNYKKDAQNLKKKLEGLNLPQNTFIQPGSVTSKDIILNDLEKIIKNYDYMEKEIINREKCLNFSTFFCKRILLNKKIEINNEISEEEPTKILNNEELYYPIDSKNMTLKGPYKIKSPCWKKDKNDKEEHYLYEMEENVNGIKKVIPKIATTNYYREIKTNGGEMVLDKAYKKAGLLDWRAVFVTTTYACNNLEYQSILATINAYYKKYKDKNILSNLEEKDGFSKEYKNLIEKGLETEKALFAEKFPSQKTLNSLGGYYANIYSFVVKEQHKNNQHPWLDDYIKIKDELLNRYLFIERRFADFDRVINFFSFLLDSSSQMYRFIEGNSEAYTYYIRNGYSLTYLGFSSSVWKNNEPLQYIDFEKSKLREDLKDYEEMVREFGEEYVAKINSIPRSRIWYEILGHPIE